MIAGIVLAAGRSTRMGQPKALLRLGGETFLQAAVRALAQGGCDLVRVVVAPDSDPELNALSRDAGAEVVVNPRLGSEQLHSLQCALDSLPSGARAVVVLPVDVPTAGAGTVRRLVQAFEASGAAIVLPTAHGAHGHPVLFSRTVWPELLSPTLTDGARQVVHAHSADRVEVPVESLAPDVDTPEEYARLVGR